jgi:hypothetical protein
VRLALLVLVLAAGALVPTAGAARPLRLAELPGVEALPNEPPLAPPQPPLLETPRLRGTVSSRNRVAVGIDPDGTPNSVTVVQRLEIRALGDYAFLVPAPAVSVTAAAGSESQPGFRQNQIVWQGFSPRRKVLAAAAELRLDDSVRPLPLRLRIAGAPTRPGAFELVITLENGTLTSGRAFTAEAIESDVTEAVEALRAAARVNRMIESRAVRIRSEAAAAEIDVWAPLAVRGAVRFPAGTVRDLKPTRFERLLGRDAVRVTVQGEAVRAAVPRVRVVAEPVPAAAVPPPSTRRLETAVRGFLAYSHARQYERFLANPDPAGPSSTTYIYETAPTVPAAPPADEPSDDSRLFLALVLGALTLLGAGLIVLWSHL